MAVDDNFNIIYWNKIAEKMLGWTEEEVIGRHSGDLLQTRFENSSREDFCNKLLKDGHYLGDLYYLCKDKTYLPVEVNVKKSDQKGKKTSILASIHDISKRKQRDEKLKRTVDELKRSNKELKRFAYVSSHDLQEPLRMVTLYSQLLEKRYKNSLDNDANDFINYIVENAKRMKQLIEDLLEYSKVTNDAKKFGNVDLEKVVDIVISNLSIPITGNNVNITRKNLPTIFADENQMLQVFQNLITNAIKFKGKKHSEIHISAKKEEGKWIFAIKDNGIGIKPDYVDQIFEVFKRLHTKEEYPGTGIGLSIVQKIINHHGGRIWVESEPGHESTFYFTIPIIND
ncbi:MAG: ATP-binding protein [Methanobacterium sp.]|nr:ATP-binding protein [Methanobacterium sp.]